MNSPMLKPSDLDGIKAYCERLIKKLNKRFDLPIGLTFKNNWNGGRGDASFGAKKIRIGMGLRGWSCDWHGGFVDYQRIHPKITGLGKYYPTGMKTAYYLVLHEYAHIIVGALLFQRQTVVDLFPLDGDIIDLDLSSHGKVFQFAYNKLVDMLPYRKPSTKKTKKRPLPPPSGTSRKLIVKIKDHTLSEYSATPETWGGPPLTLSPKFTPI